MWYVRSLVLLSSLSRGYLLVCCGCSVESVEEDVVGTLATTITTPSWALDRLDQTGLPLDGQYSFNAGSAGTGVDVYIVDSGKCRGLVTDG
jgi:hypothetical protein